MKLLLKRSLVIPRIFLLLLLLGALLLAGFSVGGSNGPTISVTDCVGRTVEVPAEPQAIATLDPFAGQAVIMFGYGDRMTATVGGVQRDELLQAICPALKDATIAKESGAVNKETLLELGIDLMFIKSDMYQNETERAQLDALGIPYIVIDYDSMASQREAMHVIGAALSCQEEAAQFETYYQQIVDQVSAVVATIPAAEYPTVYHACSEALRTDPKESLGADWIAVTGAENVSVNSDDLTFQEQNYYTTLEQIFEWDPDYIICNESGVPDYIMNSKKWAGLRAVRENHVLQVPIGVSRWGHESSTETPLAILWLAQTLYPEYFPEVDIVAEMNTYYTTFYDYEIDDATAQEILSGKGIRTAGVDALTQD